MVDASVMRGLYERLAQDPGQLEEIVEQGSPELVRLAIGTLVQMTEPAPVSALRTMTPAIWQRVRSVIGDNATVRRLETRAGLRLFVAGDFRPPVAGLNVAAPTGALLQIATPPAARPNYPADLVEPIDRVMAALVDARGVCDGSLEVALARIAALTPTYEYDRTSALSELVVQALELDSVRGRLVAEWFGYEAVSRQQIGRRRREWPPSHLRQSVDFLLSDGRVVVLDCLVAPLGARASLALWGRRGGELSAFPSGRVACSAVALGSDVRLVPAGGGDLVEILASGG